MRLNSRGEILAGIGKAWLTDDVWIEQRGPETDWTQWKTLTSHGEVLDEQGFNTVCAGGGKWATWLNGRGPKGNFGPLDPAGIVLDIGRDGTVAWCPSYQEGMRVEGTPVLFTRVCGPGHIVYTLADGRIYSTRLGFASIPKGVQPFRAYVIDWALLYHTHEYLILQHFHQPSGWIVAQKPAYSPDFIETGAGWRVVWCLNEGETQTAERVIPYLAAQTDLSGLRDFPVVPVPPVHPPEPIPMPGITDSQFATLERVRAKYGETLNEAEIGALLNEVAWFHKAEGVGMQRKDGGTNATQPTTGIKVWRGMRFAGNIGQDVLGQASIGRCLPVRGEVGPADPASFVAPVLPEGVVIIEPPPTPVPVPVPTDVSARLTAIESRLAKLEAWTRGV